MACPAGSGMLMSPRFAKRTLTAWPMCCRGRGDMRGFESMQMYRGAFQISTGSDRNTAITYRTLSPVVIVQDDGATMFIHGAKRVRARTTLCRDAEV